MPFGIGGGGRILQLLFLILVLIHNERIGGMLGKAHALDSFYSNVTLRANGGDLSAVIYLPVDLKPSQRTYYRSSRFDWSSLIGSITRTTINPNTGLEETHTLYGTKQWRLPHDPYWAESGVGLASEFGVGTDGSLCDFLCGWNQNSEVTNGVLGYQAARSGESFLKIGVGELIKGSCVDCDSSGDYKYNSPYQFARPPVWTLETNNNHNSNTIVLSHAAKLEDRDIGYKLEKHITLHDDQLLVKTVLSNLGSKQFSTAWYSHHFFSCDSRPVQQGYSVDLDLASTYGDYTEPYSWIWSTPLKNYANVYTYNDSSKEPNNDSNDDSDTVVRIDMNRGVESHTSIKADFTKNEQSKGEFTLRACNTKIRETIPEVSDPSSGISMYAFNLYIESGTFSPEPQILLHLEPGQSTSWTQQLDFADDFPIVQHPPSKPSVPLGSLVFQAVEEKRSASIDNRYNRVAFITTVALVVALASVLYRSVIATTGKPTRGRKQHYHPVPDSVTNDNPHYALDSESDAI
eukprot:CAMPEP_0201138690 /NCGR_PEP_ID=MMETSP0850-20130426/56058_1 /ASSEMBLY_ACC=CAM_ASM_000622 /TAXON_ID=183588 /ORGANISM="Pseudo-nitzschia fraudulenta, Strain WWA7" /LENGTH=517 /DNA_ID=CAMNT_0047410089 /DNA_START=452 /DNA_END=2005 /DNA_ORIENTATION=+